MKQRAENLSLDATLSTAVWSTAALTLIQADNQRSIKARNYAEIKLAQKELKVKPKENGFIKARLAFQKNEDKRPRLLCIRDYGC